MDFNLFAYYNFPVDVESKVGELFNIGCMLFFLGFLLTGNIAVASQLTGQVDSISLFEAINQQKLGDVRKLLVKSGEKNELKELLKSIHYKRTPLDYAVQKGNFEVVKAILDAISINKELTADLLKAPDNSNSSLNYAAQKGNFEVVKAILDVAISNTALTADLLKAPDISNSPLSYAAQQGNLEVVKAILNAISIHKELTADLLKAPDNSKKTPLHYAADGGNVDVVDAILTAAGAASIDAVLTADLLKAPDKHNLTPLHYAADKANTEVVKAILNAANSDKALTADLLKAPDEHNLTPLHYAAQKGNIKILEDILAAASIDAVLTADLLKALSELRRTPLHSALANKQANIFRILLLTSKNFLGSQETFSLLNQKTGENSEEPSIIEKISNDNNKEFISLIESEGFKIARIDGKTIRQEDSNNLNFTTSVMTEEDYLKHNHGNKGSNQGFWAKTMDVLKKPTTWVLGIVTGIGTVGSIAFIQKGKRQIGSARNAASSLPNRSQTSVSKKKNRFCQKI